MSACSGTSLTKTRRGTGARLTWTRDTALVDKKAGFIDAIDPDLSAFKARGGKLLIYHGWNDGGSRRRISPLNSVNYYSSVLATDGAASRRTGCGSSWRRAWRIAAAVRAPISSTALAALERWRESGIAPDQIVAARVTNNRVDMTRPLCPYPQVAVYKGVGTTNDAGNFVCKAP